MAELEFLQARSIGADIGEQLRAGKVDDAQANYTKMMKRIEQETEETASKALKREWIERAMEDVNPVDVKGPDNGMAEGHYIYWNPETVANEAIKRIQDFCTTHNGCASLAGGNNAGDLAAASKFTGDLNSYLIQALPDPLERHVFVADFNRRRIRSDFKASLTSAFLPQITSP